MTHAQIYLEQVRQIAAALDHELIEKMAEELAHLRERGGRLILLGVGGSAANCSHA
ncbi:MAG: sugar isomerase, partial [Verrucomicrobia bacterium]